MVHKRDLAHHMDGQNQNDPFFKLLNDTSASHGLQGLSPWLAGNLELVQRVV